MPKKQFDLHLHTYYSDGKDSPETVLIRARKARLRLVSITDHNSISHIPSEKKIAERLGLNFLPGVEISCVYQGRHLHILGYGFHQDPSELKRIILGIQKKRRKGIYAITAKLKNLGFDIKKEELSQFPAEYYGLVHLIRILLRKPSERRRISQEVGSTDIFAIIKFYFAQAQEAYVAEDYLPAVKMIKLIKSLGGISCLAHPGSHLRFREDVLITQLHSSGLDAVEVFTPKHNWDQIIHYEILAKRLKMAVTAGSNYHEDFHQQDIPVITPIGYLETPPEVFDRFLKFLTTKTKFRLTF